MILDISARIFIGMEQKFILNKYIDTEFAEGFTQQKFNGIIRGESVYDFINRIGEPLVIDTFKINQGKTLVIRYSYSMDGNCRWGDFAWKSYEVIFDSNMVVIDKKVIWYYD